MAKFHQNRIDFQQFGIGPCCKPELRILVKTTEDFKIRLAFGQGRVRSNTVRTFLDSLLSGMILIIPPTPHGGALGSKSLRPNSLIALWIAHFLDFLVILMPIYISLYIGT